MNSGETVQRAFRDLLAQFAHAIRKNIGSLRRFSGPERHAGRRAVRVLDMDLSGGFDPLHAPTCIAKKDDVARTRIDRKVLVQRSDLHSSG